MATGIKLPPGFVLEEDLQAQNTSTPMNLPEGFVLESDLPKEPSVPEWGMKRPNLYGAAKAAEAVFTPMVKEDNPIVKGASAVLQPNFDVNGMKVPNPLTFNLPLGLIPGSSQKETASMISGGTSPGALAMLATGAMGAKAAGEFKYNDLAKLIGGAVKDIPQEIGSASGKMVGNIKNVIKPDAFAKEVRTSMFGLRSKLGKQLDSEITRLSAENPTKTVDLSNEFRVISEAAKNAEVNPGLASDIQRTIKQIKDPQTSRMINSLIKNPEGASELTLRQSEEIKRAVSQSPTIKAKMAQGKFANWTAGDMELLDLLDNIKSSQAEQFKELATIRKPYAEFMQNYNTVKGKFKPGALIRNMQTKFSDAEIYKMAERVLPPETWKKITGFRRTGNAVKGAAISTGLTGGSLLIGKFLKRIFGS